MTVILSEKRSDWQLSYGFDQITTALPAFSAVRSDQLWAIEPTGLRPADLKTKQPLPGWRTVAFLIVFCIGFSATLTCQSYGDASTGSIAGSKPQLGWLETETAAADSAGEMVSPGDAATGSDSREQLKSILIDRAPVWQRTDQLLVQFSASQQQVAADIPQTIPAQRNKVDSTPPSRSATKQAAKVVPRQLPPDSPAALGLRGSFER
jgi:hypothetical protein